MLVVLELYFSSVPVHFHTEFLLSGGNMILYRLSVNTLIVHFHWHIVKTHTEKSYLGLKLCDFHQTRLMEFHELTMYKEEENRQF